MMYMRLATLATLLSAVLAIPASQHSAVMRRLMAMKIQTHERMRAAGAFEANTYKNFVNGENVQCTNGKAGEYGCKNMHLHSFIDHNDLGSKTGEGNDIWGWAADDGSGREFGIVGQTDGTSFVEVLEDGSLVRLGRLPTHTTSAIWRDIKVIGHHAYIGSEARNHGMQIFDLHNLLKEGLSNRPKQWNDKSDGNTHYAGFGNSHNIVANEETKMIYAVGTSTCRGGPHIVDVSDPSKPKQVGCVSQDAYTHDAQCVNYKGPDTRYQGREICFNYNEDSLTIHDVTDKGKGSAAIGRQLSRTTYKGSAYTHQGWLIDDEHTMLLADDELDEKDGTDTAKSGHTVTYLWDVSDLENPVLKDTYKSPVKSIDHNQYTVTKNGRTLVFQSNYQSGIRVVDVTSAKANLNATSFEEVAFFDCHPDDDAQGGIVEFGGTWSNYPYLPSGFILMNSIERGVYSLKLDDSVGF